MGNAITTLTKTLAKLLADKEDEVKMLHEKIKKLEDQVAEYMGMAHGLSNVTQEQEGIIEALKSQIAELEKAYAGKCDELMAARAFLRRG